MEYTARKLNSGELRYLKTLRNQTEKAGGGKFTLIHYIAAGLSGAVCVYLASITGGNVGVFILGTLAVFLFAFVIFMPYEAYKMKKRSRDVLLRLNDIINKGMVDTCRINATRCAVAKERDDESDLYIIEIGNDKVLYMWDMEYNLNRKFPCLMFEIYDDSFYKLTGRQIYALSEKIKPYTVIDPEIKGNYMKKTGAPGHLAIENMNFDDVIKKWQAENYSEKE